MATPLDRQEISIELLKERMPIDETQLDEQVEETDLPDLSAYFDNTDSYVEKLGLTPGQQKDVKTETLYNNTQAGMKMALKYWKNRNPLIATFRALLVILISLSSGSVAVKVWEYLKSRREVVKSKVPLDTRLEDLGSENTTIVCSGETFVCPYCGECTMEQFFSEGCPKQSTVSNSKQNAITFPFLNTSGLAEADRIDLEFRLKLEMEDLKRKFSKLTLHVMRLLRSISIEEIKLFLLTLDSFTDDIGVKLFDEEDAKKIDASTNIVQIFIVLRNYITFFNYHILEDIVNEHGIARQDLDEYLETFYTFCRRSIFEVPGNLFPTLSRTTAKVYAFKCTAGVATLKGIEDISKKIAKKFCLRPAAMQLCTIKKGCVELHFLISAAVADHIFPASPSQLSALSEISVRVLFCKPQTHSVQRKIHAACRGGHIDVLKRLLQAEVDPNIKNRNGWTPLHVVHSASLLRQVDVTKTLLQAGADPNIKNNNGWTALYVASLCGRVDVARTLLKAGADPNIKNNNGWTALYVASLCGHLDVARTLLQLARADPNIKDRDGRTAFYVACRNGHVDVARILSQAGADPNIKDTNGETALHVACRNGRIDVAKTLLQAGADPNIKDGDGQTALYVVCRNGNADVAKVLLQAGADSNIETWWGRTALYVACGNGHVDVAKILLQAGADPNTKNDDGQTAFYVACRNGRVNVAMTLLQAGADPNIKDDNGETDLHVACRNGRIDVAKTLLQAGADPNIKDGRGQTALHVACRNGDINVAKTLLQAGADSNIKNKDGWTALYVASLHGHVDVAKSLLQEGADPNIKDRHGQTVLHVVCENGHVDATKILLRAGANPNIKNRHGQTALHVVCENGRVDIAKTLLQARADPNIKNNSGQTALHVACENGHIGTAKTLIQGGAGPNIRDYRARQTALHVACRNSLVTIAKTLLQAGADPNIMDRFRQTSLHIACENGRVDVANTLLQAGADPNINNWRLEETALHVACRKGYVDIAKALLQAEADPNIMDREENTALDVAMNNNRFKCEQLIKEHKVQTTPTGGKSLDEPNSTQPTFQRTIRAVFGKLSKSFKKASNAQAESSGSGATSTATGKASDELFSYLKDSKQPRRVSESSQHSIRSWTRSLSSSGLSRPPRRGSQTGSTHGSVSSCSTRSCAE